MSTGSIPLKQCSRKEKCIHPLGCWQPATTEYFRKASKEKSGLTSRCKSCLRPGDAKYREEHPDQHHEWYEQEKIRNPDYLKNLYLENRDSIIARSSKYAKDHPEIVNARSRRAYQRHKDEKLAYQKEYYSTNPEKLKARGKKYKDTHKEQVAAYNKEYDKAHPERARAKAAKRRVRIADNGGNFTRADVLRIFDEQNGKCAYCNKELTWSIARDIHIDHIKPLSKGGTNSPDNLCLACAKCNLSKADKTLADWIATRGW